MRCLQPALQIAREPARQTEWRNHLADFYAPTGMQDGGPPYQVHSCISSAVTAVLSVTGVLIWWRKRGRKAA